MEKLVIYSSKNNTSAHTAKLIENSKNYDICDMKDVTKNDLSEYKDLIVGFGIYAGNLSAEVKKFFRSNFDELKDKNITIFVHGIISDESYHDIVSHNIKDIDKLTIASLSYLGGALDFDKQNFIVKKLLKTIAREKNLDVHHLNTLSDDAIAVFISKI